MLLQILKKFQQLDEIIESKSFITNLIIISMIRNQIQNKKILIAYSIFLYYTFIYLYYFYLNIIILLLNIIIYINNK